MRPWFLLSLVLLAASFAGCSTRTWERQSDLEWQKYSPNYQPPYRNLSGREWGW